MKKYTAFMLKIEWQRSGSVLANLVFEKTNSLFNKIKKANKRKMILELQKEQHFRRKSLKESMNIKERKNKWLLCELAVCFP